MKCHPTNPPTIALGVTGSIAAFKAADLTSKLRQKNYQVQVIMTESATKLVQPQTFFTLSQLPVITSLWDTPSWQPTHIGLAEKCSLFVIAPASADIIAKLAMLLIKANDLPKDTIKKVLQVLADIFADETFDIEEKQSLLLALDEMRKLPSFAGENRILIPD